MQRTREVYGDLFARLARDRVRHVTVGGVGVVLRGLAQDPELRELDGLAALEACVGEPEHVL